MGRNKITAKKLQKIGETNLTNEGYLIEIIKFNSSVDCTIKFENGFIIPKVTYENFRNGGIKNPFHKSLYNVGYVGEGNYLPSTHKKYYAMWTKILEMCYNEKSLITYPTYENCIVCEEWHNFQNFVKWCDKFYIEDYRLSKEILVKNNKLYSPLTCCFIPNTIYTLFNKKQNYRGQYPIGVSFSKQRKKLTVTISINGKQNNLGFFDNELEAFNCYKIAKEKDIKEKAYQNKDLITNECFEAMLNYQVEITD